jgi:hypothetical protein
VKEEEEEEEEEEGGVFLASQLIHRQIQLSFSEIAFRNAPALILPSTCLGYHLANDHPVLHYTPSSSRGMPH